MQSIKLPAHKWRKGPDIPAELSEATSVVINNMVYCGGNSTTMRVVLQYNTDSGIWSRLPPAPVRDFFMTPLNGQLVLAGGAEDDHKIRVWNSVNRKWCCPYPPMPTGRSQCAAMGYQNYLIVACGSGNRDTVEVFDNASGRWYSAQPVPVGGHKMSATLVGDHWYLSSFGQWEDEKEHIFRAHLPTLISSAMSASTSTASSIWQELPTLLALHGHLLLVGGQGCVQQLHHYDTETEEWRESGQLPVGMSHASSVLLPSGEVMVAGGKTEDGNPSLKMWIGLIQTPLLYMSSKNIDSSYLPISLLCSNVSIHPGQFTFYYITNS